MKVIRRHVTISFYRNCNVKECDIKREKIRTYSLTESSITRLNNFIRDNDIRPDVDIYAYTDIRFDCDKEIDEDE